MAEHPTTTTITQTRMPPEIVPYFGGLARKAQDVVADKYQAYGGQRLAGFTQPEVAAQQGYTQFGMSGGPGALRSANAYMQGATSGLSSLAGKMGTSRTQGYQNLTNLANRYAPYGGGVSSLGGRVQAGPQDGVPGYRGYPAGVGPGGGPDYMSPVVPEEVGGPVGGGTVGTLGPVGAPPVPNIYGGAGDISAMGLGKYETIADAAKAQASMLGTDLAPYMNPYTQNVSAIREREALERGRRAMSDLRSQVSLAGGSGGYRSGLLEQDLQRSVRQEVDDIRNQGLQSAYGDAQRMFEADRAAAFTGRTQQLGAQQAAEGARRFGWEGGIKSLDAQIAAQRAAEAYRTGAMGQQQGAYQGVGELSGVMSGLGAQEQQLLMERLANLESVGQRQRALTQAGMDTGYGDFIRQTEYPKTQLGWFANILNQLPVESDQTVSRYQAQPGLFQSLLGTGVGGLALYNAARTGTG